MKKQATPLILAASGWRDYRLLDSGNGRKLEQVGGFRFIRPEAQALWEPELGAGEWRKADGEFVSSASGRDREDGEGGKWRLGPSLPESWVVQHDGLSFNAMPTPFRHYGFFPEQSSHWTWCADHITRHVEAGGEAPAVLNLFGYTGVASLHAARAGAEVTHVDSSKKAIAQAFANRDCAGMEEAPVRYITEDARSFVGREARRGRKYHGVILDPPKYGRGAKGEVWRMEEHAAGLMQDIAPILAEDALFVVLTSYAIRSSFLSMHNLVESVLGGSGTVESGELAVQEETRRGFMLGQANFARWSGAG